MIRLAIVLIAALVVPSAARAQAAFDPLTVSYVICATNQIKKFALETPPIAKTEIVDRAFRACGDIEAQARKTLSQQDVSSASIDDRFTQIKKFISETAQDDINRARANRTPQLR